MKRKGTLLLLIFMLNIHLVISQPWHYDFGDTTKTLSVSGENFTFLPLAPSGTSKVRIGTGSAVIYLENQLVSFGENTYLRIKAPSSGSFTKFALYDYTPSKSFTLKFRMMLGGANGSNTPTSGTYYIFIGNGTSFSNSTNFTGTEVFAGLRLVFGLSGSISTMVRTTAGWAVTGLSGTPFQQATQYLVEIYGNNTSSTSSYNYNGPQTVASNKWDLWVNSSLVGNDIAKGELANDVNIDSWMFNCESSSGNVANIFLDDFDYANSIVENPMPVDLSSFNMNTAGRNVLLTWTTSSEVNNAGFYVERCRHELNTEIKWENVSFIPGSGTTNEIRSYSCVDAGLKAGAYMYRLKQVDFNGNHEYFQPQNSTMALINAPANFDIKQNYPNPSNPVSNIDFQMPFDGNVSLKVYDISGKEAATLIDGFRKADFYTARFDGSNLASGVYFYTITADNGIQHFSKTLKMVLVK
jgi:hypothetical protein